MSLVSFLMLFHVFPFLFEHLERDEQHRPSDVMNDDINDRLQCGMYSNSLFE
jgi:hypothetical protein